MVKHTGPLLGYNNNVPYKGATYHVQTEDSGSRRPHVITHLFADGGRIVKTKKTSYAHFVGTEALTERVRTLMRMQHRAMVITLRKGRADHLITPPEGADPREMAKEIVETGELAPDAPINSNDSPSDDRDFQREMEALAGPAAAGGKGAAAFARAEAARQAAADAMGGAAASPSADAAPKPDEPPKESSKETSYRFVGPPAAPAKRRSGSAPASSPPSRQPSRSAPPPARGRGGALPLKKRASEQPAITGDAAKFGARFTGALRFDELVMAFFLER